MTDDGGQELLSFGDHLEVLRRMLFRIIAVAGVIAVVVFCFKETTFSMLLAPSEWDFVTYRAIEQVLQAMGFDFHFEPYHVQLIATELQSQFMTHISTAVYLGLLAASPYIMYELFRFISPALYENERRYSVRVTLTIYVLFVMGVLLTYFVLFPISFRFLGTYSVAESVTSTITIDSYISSMLSLTLVMGAVFQLPVICFILGKLGLINSTLLARYRRHAFVLLMLIAAIITPPDIMTLVLVSLPLYMLYEVSIWVVR
jgi:sec-independent protein translocase protein TatC